MSPLQALFGKGETGPQPDLTTFVPGGAGDDVLLVDGATPPGGDAVAAALAGCVVLAHDRAAAAGLPFHEGDARRLPSRAGGWRAIVLLDVVDRVLDPARALRAAAEALAAGGSVVVLQQVAPDDVGARGAWNALARLRDDRHTWTPTRRQVRAVCGDAGLTRGREALWDEECDVTASLRPTTATLHRTYVAALEHSGLVRGGRVTLRRLGLVLTHG